MTNPQPPQNPLSIRSAGGIEAFLNQPDIRRKHNGLGYADFDERLRLRVPLGRIAEDFNVSSTNTIKSWKKWRASESDSHRVDTGDRG